MLIKAKCEHCGNVFETDGMNRTEFCPHCGKETSILAQVAVPALGVPQSHRLWTRIVRPLILFVLLPIVVVGFMCHVARQNQIAKARYEAAKWEHEHKLTEWEKVEVQEKLKNEMQDARLAIDKMNHPDGQPESTMLNTNTK